ncbi:MAG: hypothetical protein AAFS10_13510 [Myxococcota bacterium]
MLKILDSHYPAAAYGLLFSAILMITIASVPTGCGDSDGDSFGGACSTDGCGGEGYEGIWDIKSACGFYQENLDADICVGAVGTTQFTQGSGTMTFNADGTYSIEQFQVTALVRISIPNRCFDNGLGTPVNCATFAELFRQELPTITCNTLGSTCDCSIIESNGFVSEEGTYTTEGTTLTMTPTRGLPSTGITYCAEGDTFELYFTDDEDEGGFGVQAMRR